MKNEPTLVWNNRTSKYEVKNGTTPTKCAAKLRGHVVPEKLKVEDDYHWRRICWYLALSLGITLAIILALMAQ